MTDTSVAPDPSLQVRRTPLERLIPLPQQREVDHVELAAECAAVWNGVRHSNLARSPLVRGLLCFRALPGKLPTTSKDTRLCIDDFQSTPEQPGFQLLVDEPGQRFTVGAVARVERFQLAFVHIGNAQAFTDFEQPGYMKLAWAVDILPLGSGSSRLQFELRVTSTDKRSWGRARRYLALIGPGMHLVRRRVLSSLAGQFGWPKPRYHSVAVEDH